MSADIVLILLLKDLAKHLNFGAIVFRDDVHFKLSTFKKGVEPEKVL
jgi:hypothetical protein